MVWVATTLTGDPRRACASLVPRLVRGRGEKSLVHTVCACSVPPGFLGIRKLADITPYTIPSIIVFFVRCTTIEDGGDFARFR